MSDLGFYFYKQAVVVTGMPDNETKAHIKSLGGKYNPGLSPDSFNLPYTFDGEDWTSEPIKLNAGGNVSGWILPRSKFAQVIELYNSLYGKELKMHDSDVQDEPKAKTPKGASSKASTPKTFRGGKSLAPAPSTQGVELKFEDGMTYRVVPVPRIGQTIVFTVGDNSAEYVIDQVKGGGLTVGFSDDNGAYEATYDGVWKINGFEEEHSFTFGN